MTPWDQPRAGLEALGRNWWLSCWSSQIGGGGPGGQSRDPQTGPLRDPLASDTAMSLGWSQEGTWDSMGDTVWEEGGSGPPR